MSPGQNAGTTENRTQQLLWVQDVDMKDKVDEMHTKTRTKGTWKLLCLSFSTLGVVYGDIGTSPLYVYSSTFPEGAPDDDNRILGVLSMIFWTITSVVLFKYVILMLRADDKGEGGIISLYSIIKRAAGIPSLAQLDPVDDDLQHSWNKPKHRVAGTVTRGFQKHRWQQIALFALVVLATNMIISDGVLTPAISVISAVEGIAFNTGLSENAVIGITIGILVVLFSAQSFGTEKISFFFSPIVLLWFGANASIGIFNLISYRPSAIKGLSPHYIYYFWSGHASTAWRTLGSIMLSITGAEALYADLGHFDAASIRLSFISIVYPSLILTYAGQTSFILENKQDAKTAFWSSTPNSVYIPMVVLATLAAIIASQALITGAFSIVRQGTAVKCLPRVTVRHTSESLEGQIYAPEVNFLLMVGCIIVVAAFKTSTKIGNAYGLAIVSVMVIDTYLLALVMLLSWNWHPVIVGLFFIVYSFISCAYLSSTLEKIPHGAWFVIALVGVLCAVSFVYWWGQTAKIDHIKKNAITFSDLFEVSQGSQISKEGEGTLLPSPNWTSSQVEDTRDRLHQSTVKLYPGTIPLRLVLSRLPVARLPGIGFYYSELLEGVPPALVHFLSLSPAMHEVVVLITIRRVALPRVGDGERLLIRKLEFSGIYHAVARYGYMENVILNGEFVREVVHEIQEYVRASTIIEEASELASDISRHGPRDEEEGWSVSVGTAAGQQLLAEIQARLRGGKEAKATKEATAADQRPCSRVLLTTPAPTMPKMGAGPSCLWVRQPSRLTRLPSSRSRLGGDGSSTTVPLPPPPPRPSIHRLSAPLEASSDQYQLDGAGSQAVSISLADADVDDTQTHRSGTQGADPVEFEQQLLLAAYGHGIVHLLGRVELCASSSGAALRVCLKQFLVDVFYSFISRNSRSASSDYHLPAENLMEVTVRLHLSQ